MSAKFLPCDKCGVTGIHACAGLPSSNDIEKMLSDAIERDIYQKLGLITNSNSATVAQKPMTYEELKAAHEALIKHQTKKAEQMKWEYLNRPLRVTLTKESFACIRIGVA